ncbi:glycerol 3-phosphate dehydrogenase (quinone) subunit B [Desulfacinum hydrothermale DSM 13146]|uniref:Glycerol 3-phosphate dehydrogenase (Quinone) subunit B n=1 Tax=Desulfacinum hydrothermale DSM 13146 TaxID=1121390 RepID=A0A1W1XQ85_9BACT|nr:glycerol-3-phosphate dehydrogenase subunit GlpB [Desulfacinum hydrothermale]SMC26022.1 glycerol 3-phosphate dehydrogenase (quinone) subunit B [Desulfacinum hydrothermale DSM 13146]
MSGQLDRTTVDVAVIGAGMAGLAAALFAARRGLRVAVVGTTGPLIFSSGFVDLLGVHPVSEGQVWDDPWTGLDALARDLPNHPYARLARRDMEEALDVFLDFLGAHGLAYHQEKNRNLWVVTAAGTLKPTYAVPWTMKNAVTAYEEKWPCLLVGLEGLKGFSARQAVSSLQRTWPGVRSCTVAFPEPGREIFPEQVAGDLAAEGGCERLAERIRPHLGDARAVGLPAVCGIHDGGRVFRRLETALGLPLFEIPTMPPSLPGLRLKNLFEEALPQEGVDCRLQHKVLGHTPLNQGGFLFDCGSQRPTFQIQCRGAVLATGRFFGRGLLAERTGVRETVFDLPVVQPESRSQWHRKDFFDPQGHPVNRSGLAVDEHFRPLDPSGRPAFATLTAAGSVLAHHDWMREKCGAGLAVTTAWAAVASLADLLGQEPA